MHHKLIEIVTSDVCEMFMLDEDFLFNLKLEHGLLYIQQRYYDDTEVAEALRTSHAFWQWWNELWAYRDRRLMRYCQRIEGGVRYLVPGNYPIGQRPPDTVALLFGMESMIHFYRDYHNPKDVQFYPNSVLIGTCERERYKRIHKQATF